jgi:hypothetical protein
MTAHTTNISQHYVAKMELTKSFLETSKTHYYEIEIFDKDGNKLTEITLFAGDENEKIEIVFK